MKKATSKKEMTLDDLAGMVARGFDGVRKEMHDGFADIRKEMHDGFEAANDRSGKIENHHGRRLDNLEDKHRIVATAFDKNFKIKLSK